MKITIVARLPRKDEFAITWNDVATWIAEDPDLEINKSTGYLLCDPGQRKAVHLGSIWLTQNERSLLPEGMKDIKQAWYVVTDTSDAELGDIRKVRRFSHLDEAEVCYSVEEQKLRKQHEQYMENLKPKPRAYDSVEIPPEWDEAVEALTSGLGGAIEPYSEEEAKNRVKRAIHAGYTPDKFLDEVMM